LTEQKPRSGAEVGAAEIDGLHLVANGGIDAAEIANGDLAWRSKILWM